MHQNKRFAWRAARATICPAVSNKTTVNGRTMADVTKGLLAKYFRFMEEVGRERERERQREGVTERQTKVETQRQRKIVIVG